MCASHGKITAHHVGKDQPVGSVNKSCAGLLLSSSRREAVETHRQPVIGAVTTSARMLPWAQLLKTAVCQGRLAFQRLAIA